MGSAGQQSIDVTALPGPPDPLQHRTPATGGITSQHRQQEGTHGQTSSGTSPMGQQLMSSRQASPFRDQDSQQRSRTEEDFPFAWTTLDASFDKYLEFAITKSLAKFPKQIRREVRTHRCLYIVLGGCFACLAYGTSCTFVRVATVPSTTLRQTI